MATNYGADRIAAYGTVETGGFGAGSFSLANGGGDFTPLKVFDIKLTDTTEHHEQKVQDIEYYKLGLIKGASRAEIEFKAQLGGPYLTTQSGAPVAGDLGGIGMLLKNALGIVEYGCAPTVEDVGQASTTSKVYLTTGTGLTSGQLITVETSSGVFETVPIAVYASNVATLSKKLSAAPLDGGNIYGLINFAPLLGSVLASYTLRIVVVSLHTNDMNELYGVRLALESLEYDDGVLTATFKGMAAICIRSTHSLTQIATFGGPSPRVNVGVKFAAAARGTWASTYDKSDVANWTPANHAAVKIAKTGWKFNTGMAVSAKEVANSDISGSDVDEFVLTAAEPSIEYEVYHEQAFYDEVTNQTEQSILTEWRGSAVGKGAALWIPRALPMQKPERGEVNNIASLTIKKPCAIPVDTDESTFLDGGSAESPQKSTTGVRNAPFVLALGC